MVLQAYGACLTIGYAMNAAVRGIRIRDLKVDPEGEIDLPGFLFCASGFENGARARSALMFATLAASANLRTVLYCIQDAVDVMVKEAIENNERPDYGQCARRFSLVMCTLLSEHCSHRMFLRQCAI